MADPHNLSAEALVRKVLADDHADLDREAVGFLSREIMEAEVTAQIGAAHGERAPDARSTQRNGYRQRRWDTRADILELLIPKGRSGSHFPSLLEPRTHDIRHHYRRSPSGSVLVGPVAHCRRVHGCEGHEQIVRMLGHEARSDSTHLGEFGGRGGRVSDDRSEGGIGTNCVGRLSVGTAAPPPAQHLEGARLIRLEMILRPRAASGAVWRGQASVSPNRQLAGAREAGRTCRNSVLTDRAARLGPRSGA